MIDADKKFHGGRRYYHRHEVATREGEDMSFEERKELRRKGRRRRFLGRVVVGFVVLGAVIGTYYLLMP